MEAAGNSSDIIPLNSLEIESAWHLLSLLIRQGCPPRLPDLSLRSSLGQNHVEFLCRIPGSPLTITAGGFISVSDTGVTYVRKRKAQNPGNADVLFSSSKKRSSLKHKRGDGEPMQNRGTPKLLSSSDEISRKAIQVTFDVARPSYKERYTGGMDTMHCCTVGLDRVHNISALHDLNCFEFGDIGCIREEDTRACTPFVTNSMVPYESAVDFSYECTSLDAGLNASIMKEHALQKPELVEHDFRPLLDGMLDQPSLMNQTLVEDYLGEDYNNLSLELGLVSGIPDAHALERLNIIEKDFASLIDRVWDETAVDHISQYASLLTCTKLPITEAIDERNLHSKDDELVKPTCTFDGGDQNSAALEFMLGLGMMRECAYGSEVKHRTSCEPSIQNNILAGSNSVNNTSSSREGPDKIMENFSQQKLIPNFESLIMEKEQGSAERELMEAEGLTKQPSLSNEITMQNSQEQKLLPNLESFIMQREECSGEEEPWKNEGWTKELSFSNQISPQVNFDVPSPPDNEQHSFGMDTLDCSAAGLDLAYDLPAPLLDTSYFELRNISYMVDDTASTAPYNANSVISNVKVDISNDDALLDVGLNDNITKEHALQRSSAVELEPDVRPSLDGVLDQPSVMNQTLGEDCNILSVNLGFVAGISEVHTCERLSMIEKNFEQSLVEHVRDGTELHHADHNDQNASTLPCKNHLVIEAIDERNLHTKDDRLITGQLESNEIIVASTPSHCHGKETLMLAFACGDDVKNSAAVEPATMVEHVNVSEVKQRPLNDPHMKDHSASLGLQNLAGSKASNSTSSTKEQDRNVEIGLMVNHKVKDICNVNVASKENRVDATTMASKNSSEQKLMPNFESFIIEEEEGSGGYGTVYKAQRKEDGRIFAVKCPHANAHSHHVNNELKMLERFGGRNFVIKYEGSFKNGDSECFVLEHVEHDRPEILKKEIGLFELQWYGFCMFRALASLHKQGVVHRDVKPGNFLFSRNVNKGYLIDFNLASDLHQKFCRSSKRKTPSASTYPNSLLESKSLPSLHSKKFADRGLLENTKKEAANDSKRIQTSKNSKKKSQKDQDIFPIIDKSKHGSQTADVSGLTSTKDQTSNKTHTDWLNQPMPSKGRKELINFVHKAMHSSQNLKPASNGPSSQRKRIAAPMAPTDPGLLILTPMPLHSGGNAVPGAGQKNKVGGKVKREGPCVGTKGFRAPEVLFKSFHQGCKIDMWSAGVTMLYLMIGRAPFGGDPEQNIKEIARLRGSEDLWEVAKLHNCETSFPVDLLDVGSLKSMGLKEWCAKNTRRPDFLEHIPESLFDLVDKCLTVNPRCRVSAEDALMHKFFAPCHDSIKKQRLLRKVASSDPSSSNG